MQGKKHRPEQIIKKLREAEMMLAAGYARRMQRETRGRYCQKLPGRQKGLPSLALVSTFVRCAAEFDGSLAAASGRIGMIHR